MTHPNPSKWNVNLLFFSRTETVSNITLSDINGKEVYRGKAPLTADKMNCKIILK
jgi:hypothetical protein